jgi:flagellar protein FlaG
MPVENPIAAVHASLPAPYTPAPRQGVPSSASSAPLPPAHETTGKAAPGDEAVVHAAVKTLNQNLVKPPLEARYSIDDNSKRIVIKIIHQESGEVLRQIPSEEVLRLAAAANTGSHPSPTLVDETA